MLSSILSILHILYIRLLYSKLFYTVRTKSLRIRGAKVGNNVRIRPFVTFSGCKNIIISDNVYIGEYTIISATNSAVTIGKNSLIGPRALLVGRSHNILKHLNFIDSGYSSAPVKISDNVWLGANVTVVSGVTLNENCVVGAGSVVLKDASRGSRIAGVPAKPINYK